MKKKNLALFWLEYFLWWYTGYLPLGFGLSKRSGLGN